MVTNSGFPGCCAIQIIHDLSLLTQQRLDDLREKIRSGNENLYGNPTLIATTAPEQLQAIAVLEANGFKRVSQIMSNHDRERIITMWQRDPDTSEDTWDDDDVDDVDDNDVW